MYVNLYNNCDESSNVLCYRYVKGSVRPSDIVGCHLGIYVGQQAGRTADISKM